MTTSSTTLPTSRRSKVKAVSVRKRTTVVLDTCVLISDPGSIEAFGGCDVVIPLTVVEELDQQKTRADEVGWAARSAIRAIEALRARHGDLRAPVPLPDNATLRVELNGLRLDAVLAHGLDPVRSDNRILAAALGLSEQGVPVKLVSNDAALRIKAAQFGLVAEDYLRNRPVEGHGVGWHSAEVSAELVDRLYHDGRVPVGLLAEHQYGADEPVELAVNECGALKAGGQSVLVRRIDDMLVRLAREHRPWGLSPRSKEQRFALELLTDPAVSVVALAGHAGTGKTILALAAGLDQVAETGTYGQLGIYRPVIAVGKADLGFLPGALDEKLDPWMAAIGDNLIALTERRSRTDARRVRDDLVAREQLVFGSIAHIRGRSIANSYLIVDEAQNLEASVAKAILTRAGEGTKIVFTGDPSQIDSPYLSRSNNALSALIDAFRGRDCFGYMVLTQGERSEVAELAAQLL